MTNKEYMPRIVAMKNIITLICLTIFLSLEFPAKSFSGDSLYDIHPYYHDYLFSSSNNIRKEMGLVLKEEEIINSPRLTELKAIPGDIILFDGLGNQRLYRSSSDLWKNSIARIHLSGDYKTAYSKYKSAAISGKAFAQYNLGVMYEEGQGIQVDYEAAVKWYRLASKQEVDISKFKNFPELALERLRYIKKELMEKAIKKCLYDNVEKITGSESKEIIEDYCKQKLEKKSLDWLMDNFL